MLLVMIFIEHAGTGASMVVSPFTYKYVLMQPYAAGEIFKWYVGSSLVSLALWLPLSRKIGKKQTWMIGLIAGIAGYIMVFMLGEGEVTWMKAAVVLTGACSACGTVIGSSILADVIDADELETGDRKEGAYYSAYTFLYKASSGVMASITGFVLAGVGYVASQPVQTESVRLAIRSLHGLIPVVTMLVGAIILTQFSLTEEKHEEIRKKLEARRSTEST